MLLPLHSRLITCAFVLGITCILAGAQSTSYTIASGYNSHDLFVGFNPIGLSLHESKVDSGTLTGESGAILTDTAATFNTSLNDATATYLIEILDGAQAGAVAEIASVDSDTQITLAGAVGAGTTAAYCIRPAKTLNELFGTGANAKLDGWFDSSNADIIWVPDGPGIWKQYFYSTTGLEFRDAGDAFNSPAKPIAWFYSDAVFIQVKTTPKTLTFFGDVKITPTIVSGSNGFNLVSVPSPVGETLDESNLKDWLTAWFDSSDADILWVPDGSGGYVQYFYSSGSSQWKLSTDAFGADKGSTLLPSAVLIQRKTSDTAGIFDLPAFFSSL